MLSSLCGLICGGTPLSRCLLRAGGPGSGPGRGWPSASCPAGPRPLAQGGLQAPALVTGPVHTGQPDLLDMREPWPWTRPTPSLAQMHRPEQHEAAGGAVAVCPHGALCTACSCPRLEPGSRPACLLPLGLLHQACHQVPCRPPAGWPSAPWPPPRLGQLPSSPHCSRLLPQGHPPKVPTTPAGAADAPTALRLRPCSGASCVSLSAFPLSRAWHFSVLSGPSACLLSPRVSCPCRQHLFTL